LTAKGKEKKLISFYEDLGERVPAFSVQLNPDNQPGLDIAEGRQGSRLFIQRGGNVGVGTVKPAYRLQVSGLVAAEGRVGTFKSGHAPADGDWHTIIDNLQGCMAFEVMAHINDREDQRFALTHATLLMSSGKRGAKLRTESVLAGSRWFWGRFWNKILFRFRLNEALSKEANEPRYMLQVKTRTHYGNIAPNEPKQIFYRVSRLWDEHYEKETYSSPLQIEATPAESRPGRNPNAGGIRPRPQTPSNPGNKGKGGITINRR
ncbi:MAG: hypothetical protein AAFV07_01575, partial [Bacteroidota bacterium]